MEEKTETKRPHGLREVEEETETKRCTRKGTTCIAVEASLSNSAEEKQR
jgi:hypothetical protein